jgi:hypothetical protein
MNIKTCVLSAMRENKGSFFLNLHIKNIFRIQIKYCNKHDV